MADLHHFYHVYADGWWETPLREHVDALRRHGLLDQLATLWVGAVGTEENVARLHDELYTLGLGQTVQFAAVAREGWEQVTLGPLHEFSKTHDGHVSYAHTKGAAYYAPVNWHWRRDMEYHNFVRWREVVVLLDGGVKAAGAHWFSAAPSVTDPAWGDSGMFGGNYWWARCDALRLAPAPDVSHRFAAEHWIGQLSEVTDLSAGTCLVDLAPGPIHEGALITEW